MERIYLTQSGYERIFEELQDLKKNKRKEIIKRIAEARAQGDLSENAEYDAAREAQAHLEARIAELESKLSQAKIISDKEINTDKVSIGVKVDLKNLDTEAEFSYVILSNEEADFDKGQIGLNSPIAQALLGKQKGDKVDIQVPAGTLHYEILNISLP
jgi:transcription elongation factor GreA